MKFFSVEKFKNGVRRAASAASATSEASAASGASVVWEVDFGIFFLQKKRKNYFGQRLGSIS